MIPGRHTLSKEERLNGRNDISRLLSEGRFGSCSCFRYCVLTDNGLNFSRILVSVPKKHFKRAVKRNLLKRRIRESYRLQKEILSGLESGVDLMFVYNTREILDFSEIYLNIGTILRKISENQDERQGRK